MDIWLISIILNKGISLESNLYHYCYLFKFNSFIIYLYVGGGFMKKRIHVNMHHIRHNKKHGTNKPVITVKTSKSNTYGHEVEILGPSRVIYSPDKPLSCGARVWIETEAEVKIA